MIDVKELRIGNWVEVVGIQSTVIAIYDRHVHLEGNAIVNTIEQIHGISITDDVLLKCGFKDNNEIGETDFDYQIEYTNCRGGKSWLGIISWADGTNEAYIYNERQEDGDIKMQSSQGMICEIKHLHTLQNLYYDLRGEELEINL